MSYTKIDSTRAAGAAGVRHADGQLWSSLAAVCAVLRVPAGALGEVPALFQHVRFRAGQRVHCSGAPFDSLYVVNGGFLKTVSIDEFGSEQVLGFPMKGDLLGIDAIWSDGYVSDAIALSDCDVIALPFAELTELGRRHPQVEHLVCRAMSRDIVDKQEVIGTLGTGNAEVRVARFLLGLADRFVGMGYSGRLFNLRMTRLDIGNFLGLTFETVSRTLTGLHELGLIHVDQRTIHILDPQGLGMLRRLHAGRARSRGRMALTARAAGDPAKAPL
jgi:CRP/FNR family transcriptional regulator